MCNVTHFVTIEPRCVETDAKVDGFLAQIRIGEETYSASGDTIPRAIMGLALHLIEIEEGDEHDE